MAKKKITYAKVGAEMIEHPIVIREDFGLICDKFCVETPEEMDLIIYYIIKHMELKLTKFKVELTL